MRTFVCEASTAESREIIADNEEDAAMQYVAGEFSSFPGAYAAVWVGEKDDPYARICHTVVVPGACPLETDQFKRFTEWLMEVKGVSREVGWNLAMNMIGAADMGFELTPGVVPISLSDKETRTGQMETFPWILAGGSP